VTFPLNCFVLTNITYTYSPICLTSTHAFLIVLGLPTGSGERAVGMHGFILAAHGLALSGVLFVLLAVHLFTAVAAFDGVYKVWKEGKRGARREMWMGGVTLQFS